ncbi:MAG: phosphohydrolase [Porticoccaceae bacterium]|nr:phosphohydrolase [Porticoccaceae bacterium]
MTNSLLSLITVTLYSAAFVYQTSQARRNPTFDILRLKYLTAVAVLMHGGTTISLITHPDGLDLSLINVCVLTAFIVNTLVMTKQLDTILNTLYVLLFPVSGTLLLVAAVTAGSKPIMPASPALQAHVVSSMLAYSLITISSLQALLIELQIRQLKFKSQNKIVSTLPSLEVMEKLLFRIIFLSEVLLSISLVSGFFFYDNLQEQKLLHKVAFSSMAWLCFAILLFGRLFKGWRGPLAIRLTWISFICLALGFVGTKFVLEYILKI